MISSGSRASRRPRFAPFTIAACVALALGTSASTTRADAPPTGWDLARDPDAAERWALHVEAQRWIDAHRRAPTLDPEPDRDRMRVVLERAHAETSPDVKLRYDLGEVYEKLGMHERAADVLRPALAMAPDGPGAKTAWITLAFAVVRLDLPREERDAYRQFLAREPDPRARATALLNVAESEMRLGNLQDAIDGYRDLMTLRAELPPSQDIEQLYALAVWGLAVARDRAGDPTGAIKDADLALSLDPGMSLISKDPDVFYVPEYDRFWYIGLGWNGLARSTKDAHEALTAWTFALNAWDKYVRAADANDRWLALAKAHRDAAARARGIAEKRAKNAPPSTEPIHIDIE